MYEIWCLNVVQYSLAIILRQKNFLKNHKFFAKFDLKQKTGEKHVTSVDFDVETGLERIPEHFSIRKSLWQSVQICALDDMADLT